MCHVLIPDTKGTIIASKHKIKAKRFGSFKKSSYLCSRKESPLYAKYLGQLLESNLEN